MADQRGSYIWIDANGVTRQTILTTLAGGAAIAAAIQAASQAGLETSWESVLGAPVGAAAVGNYQSVKMAAQLTYQTATGSILKVTLPAPAIGVFLADKRTIDPANALVIALNAAVIGALSDGAGNAAVSYLGGLLQPSRNDLPPIA